MISKVDIFQALSIWREGKTFTKVGEIMGVSISCAANAVRRGIRVERERKYSADLLAKARADGTAFTDLPVEVLFDRISIRCQHIMRYASVTTIGGFLAIPENDLSKIQNFGNKSAKILKIAIENLRKEWGNNTNS
jgi:DNA-directed RNA polymerase alpha subunit